MVTNCLLKNILTKENLFPTLLSPPGGGDSPAFARPFFWRKPMSRPFPIDEIEVSDVYPAALATFLGALNRSETQGKLNSPEQFVKLLKLCFVSLNFLSVAELSQDESISRAAISKWIHGHAVPPAPTRKTVINWIKKKTEQKLHGVETASNSDTEKSDTDEIIPSKPNTSVEHRQKHPSFS
jgi:hypothetical protein